MTQTSCLTKEQLIPLLSSEGAEKKALFDRAAEIKQTFVQNKVYYRGLIEFSNICAKNCYYCGIRKDNHLINRYSISDEEILRAATFGYEQKFGSIVLQSGEVNSVAFTKRINRLLKKIHQQTNNALRITLSCGEQCEETYKQWFENGAHRYILRIETSNSELYRLLHPDNNNHRFQKRLNSLESLKKTGYQTGTGIMVGLPFQTPEDLVNDIYFMKDLDIDMVGLGPYIEHRNTPLFSWGESHLTLEERFQLTLKMIAILRIELQDINIVAATALQAIDKMGREKAIKVGANVIMPNITPGKYRDSYHLYENKPCTDENADDCVQCLEKRIAITSNEIALDEWGDSLHFLKKD